MLIAPDRDIFSNSSLGTDPQQRILTEVEDAFRDQSSTRRELEGRWVTDVQFLHGKQYQNWNAHLGKLIQNQPPNSRTVRMVWNITLRIIEDMKSALLQNFPRFNVVSTTGEWDSVQASRYGDDVLKWAAVHYKYPAMARELMSWLGSCGNAFTWYEWDQNKGPAYDMGNGQIARVGAGKMSAVGPMQLHFHPHAKNVEESPYVVRRFAVSREWAISNWAKGDPALVAQIMRIPSIDTSEGWWETTLTDVSGGVNVMSHGLNSEVDGERAFIEGYEARWLPSDKFPEGFAAKCLGQRENMEALVEITHNPYAWVNSDGENEGGHGCVHYGAIRHEGRLWYDSWMQHIRSPQVELNRRQSQTVEHANKASAAPFITPQGFAPFKQNMSNDPGRIYEGDQNARWLPQFVNPPNMPSYVIEAGRAALDILNYIVAPFGPNSQEAMMQATSGIHFAQMNEDRERKAGPLVDEWEASWEKTQRLVLKMFQQHQATPRGINVPPADGAIGRSGRWRQEFYSGADLSSDIEVTVVPGSAKPTSMVAVMAFYGELSKSGIINPMDPAMQKRIYQDLHWQDMMGTVDDLRRDYENAEQNIQEAGNPQLPPPMIDPQVDDIGVHESVYREFMKSEMFKEWHPVLQMRLRQLHGITQLIIQRQQANALAMQIQMERLSKGGGSEGSGESGARGAADSISPDSPMGGVKSMAQGFEKMLNPSRGGG